MSYLEYRVQTVPTGFWPKVLAFHWALALLLAATASVGFLMLYSVAGGSFTPWSLPQMQRFGMGLAIMFAVAMVPIWFWQCVGAGLCGLAGPVGSGRVDRRHRYGSAALD